MHRIVVHRPRPWRRRVSGHRLSPRAASPQYINQRCFLEAWRPGDRDHGDQREALVGVDGRVTHGDARAKAALLMARRGVEFDEDDGAAFERYARPCVQPCPSIHRTGVPAPTSTRPSSAGRSETQSPNPVSRSATVSACGLRMDSIRAACRRRVNSCSTASAINRLRLRSSRSMFSTRSAASVTVTRAVWPWRSEYDAQYGHAQTVCAGLSIAGRMSCLPTSVRQSRACAGPVPP